TPMINAVRTGWKEIVQLLLAHKANPDLKNGVGQTALHLVAQQSAHLDMTEIAALLLDAGADPNITDNEGRTPLADIGLPPPPVASLRTLRIPGPGSTPGVYQPPANPGSGGNAAANSQSAV